MKRREKLYARGYSREPFCAFYRTLIFMDPIIFLKVEFLK